MLGSLPVVGAAQLIHHQSDSRYRGQKHPTLCDVTLEQLVLNICIYRHTGGFGQDAHGDKRIGEAREEPQISRAFVLWSLQRLYVEVDSVETVCRMTAIELDDLAHSIKQLVSMFSRLVGVGAREQRFTRMLARCIISIRCMKSFSSDGALAAENET